MANKGDEPSDRLCIVSRDGNVEILRAPFDDALSARINCQGQCDNACGVAWYYSNEVIAIADRKILLVRGKTGTSLGTFHSPTTVDISFSSKSHYLYCGCEDKKVRIYDLKKKQLDATLDFDAPVKSVSVNRTDTYLACGLKSGKIVVHSLNGNSSSKIVLQEKLASPICTVQFSPFKSKILAMLNERGDIRVYDISKSSEIASFPSQHTAPAKVLRFSPVNKSLIVTGGLDKRINFYDFSKQQQIGTITSTLGGILNLSLSGDGITLAAVVSTGVVLLYDIPSFQALYSISSADESGIVCCSFQSISTKEVKRSGLAKSVPPGGPGASLSIPIPTRNANRLSIGSLSPLQLPSPELFGASPSAISPRGMFQDLSPRSFEDPINAPPDVTEYLKSFKEEVSQKLEDIHCDLLEQLNKQQELYESKLDKVLEQNDLLLKEIRTLRDENTQLKEKRTKRTTNKK